MNTYCQSILIWSHGSMMGKNDVRTFFNRSIFTTKLVWFSDIKNRKFPWHIMYTCLFHSLFSWVAACLFISRHIRVTHVQIFTKRICFKVAKLRNGSSFILVKILSMWSKVTCTFLVLKYIRQWRYTRFLFQRCINKDHILNVRILPYKIFTKQVHTQGYSFKDYCIL